MKCRFEHDGDCCNCGSPQYMCKCKSKICGSVVPITNADRIRAMSDEELEAFLEGIYDVTEDGGGKIIDGNMIYPGDTLGWLQQPAEEETP